MRDRGGLLKLLSAAFGVAVAVGNAIGSGILKAPGEVAALLPRPALFLGVWAAGGLYALLSSLSLAELAAMTPKAGGQYVFARRALGEYAGFVVGYGDWLSTCGSTAAAALVIGEYLSLLVPALRGSSTLIAVITTIGFALLQLRGVRLSARVQEGTSLLKAAAFAVLIAACVFGSAAPAQVALPPVLHSAGVSFVLALQAVIFTYDGWTGVIYFSEELKDPARQIPRSLILSVLFIAALYLSVNLSLLKVTSLGELAGATLAAGVAATKLFGATGEVALRWLTVLSMLSAIHAFHLMASRVLFAMARDGLFFRRAAQVDEGGTPLPALLISAAVSVLFIASGTFEQVIAVLSFFFVANYAVSFVSLFVLRRTEPLAARPFRVPLYPTLPLITLLGSVLFLIASIIGDARNGLAALALLAASFPAYRLLKRAH